MNRNTFPQPNVVAIFAIAVVAVGSSQMADAAIVQFRKAAQCSKSVVTLGDVADVRDADPAVVTQLSNIVLAPAPGAGRPLRLDFDTVRSRMQAHGINVAKTEFAGASMIVVTSAEVAVAEGGQSADGQDAPEWKKKRAERLVSQAISQMLRGTAPEIGATAITLDLTGPQVGEILKGAASGFQVRGGESPWTGPQTFELRFLDRREQIHSVTVRAIVSPQPQVLAAKYDIPRGHVLQAEDLVWRQASAAGEACTRVEDVINYETTRMLRANEPILRDGVRSTPLVRTNDIVTVVASVPGMNIKRKMKARGEGAMDEMVTLVSFDGKQTLEARVTGYHEAEVVGPPTAGTHARGVAARQPIPAFEGPLAVPLQSKPVQAANGNALHQPQRPSNVASIGPR